jgi:hypothetical protein
MRPGVQITRIALIGIQMQLQSKITRYAHDHIAKDEPAIRTFDRHFDSILIFEPEYVGIDWSHMYMA